MALNYSVHNQSMSAGELSPKLLSRSDIADYSKGLLECYNFIVQPQGGVIKRSGTVRAAEPRIPLIDDDGPIEVDYYFPFVFNRSTSRIVNLRLNRLNGRLGSVSITAPDGSLVSGVELLTALDGTEVLASIEGFSFYYFQSGDTLFLLSGVLPPLLIKRHLSLTGPSGDGPYESWCMD